MDWKNVTTTLRRWLAPLAAFFGVVLGCLALEEEYPFSHFPMYSRFPSQSYYLYIADGAGEPLPLQKMTHIVTSRLKKPFDRMLRDVAKEVGTRKSQLSPEQCEGAGEDTLQQLFKNSPAFGQTALRDASPVRLYRARIVMEEGKITEPEAEFIAEVDFR